MSSAPALRGRKDGVLFLNTYTRMKVHSYRCAARFQTRYYNRANILVVAANQLARVKSAVEDTGTTVGNARQKVDEAKIFIELYKSDIRFRDHVRAFCSEADFEFTEDKVFFAGDDTCLYLPEEVWIAFRSSDEAKTVSASLIDEADSDFLELTLAGATRKFRGPGVSTTHFISSMGMSAYREALYKSGAIAGLGHHYPILRRTTLTVRRLSNESRMKQFYGISVIRLVDSDHPNRLSFPNEIHSDNSFFCEFEQSNSSLSEFMTPYAGERDSYARAYSSFLDDFFPRHHAPAKRSPLPSRDDLAKISPERWLIAQHLDINQNRAPLLLHSVDSSNVRISPPGDATSPMNLLNVDPYIDGADAFVLSPSDSTLERDLRWWAYLMYSLIVAIKTHPRDAEKLVIIMVNEGALRFLRLYLDLANTGWTDDFPVLTDGEYGVPQKYPGLHHIRTGLCHFLLADDLTKPFPLSSAQAAANSILQQHEISAVRLHRPYNVYPVEPIALHFLNELEPTDVSFICTSHSERREVHEDCLAIGEFIAAAGKSATWPGNDRNNMRSLYGALKGCSRLIGVITEHLADAATWNGKIPDCTHPILASHIYERTLLLLSLARCHIVFPVGVGGILELSSRLLLDDYFPAFRKIPVIFYSPEYAHPGPSQTGFIEPILTTLIGLNKYDNLIKGEFLDDDGYVRPYFHAQTLDRVFELIRP